MSTSLTVIPAGTFRYLAPKCFISYTFTEKCDVYILEKLKKQDVDGGGSECEKHLQGSYKNLASQVYNPIHEGKGDEILDPFLMGKIAPRSWKMFMDIAERCLLFEQNERPAMGEVEIELEYALALQEEADAIHPTGDYSLLSI
ncbi:hypothetical protein L6164_006667 [Bauhinia variegata]|uniref:Uncharacterized protein n=1 Tax=Bauhinia variegata TaxID=167791 RepID=A0ACB9PXW1_BAUVA|nr:hypothetical protein L6164_006667 [Bauhinia variegata]